MDNYNFNQIKKRVLEWGQQYIADGNNFIELEKNAESALIFDLTFPNCLAQIIVDDQYFVPYKNVSFEAITLDSEEAIASERSELIYFFYDSEDTTEEEVIVQLNKGIQYCLNYIPNQLGTKYIGQRGKLDITDRKLIFVIHPSDLPKTKKELLEKEFTCTGTQFQYLVVENDKIKIKILP